MVEVPRPAPPRNWRDRLEQLRSPGTPSRRGALALVAVGVVVLGVVVARWLLQSPPTPPELSLPRADAAAPATGAAIPSTTLPEVLLVHVAGAVRHPGVYRVVAGARVADVVDAAGGVTGEADLDRVNLAALVADAEQVRVPRIGEPAAAGAAGIDAADTGPLDLNTATVDQLDTLPGIGPATAAAIVAHREQNGPFASVDGLLDVRGIGPAKLDAIRALVRV